MCPVMMSGQTMVLKLIRNNECKNSIKSNVLLAQAMTVIMQPVTRMTLLLMQVTVMVSH